jgi:hypothetical protein
MMLACANYRFALMAGQDFSAHGQILLDTNEVILFNVH